MRPVLFAVFFMIAIKAGGQDVSTISVNVRDKKIAIGDFVIDANTTAEKLISELGKPERLHAVAGRERFYCYDNLGIAFEVTPDDNRKVLAMTVTYYPDGDKKVASGKYVGTVMIDDFKLKPETSVDDIKAETAIKEMVCMGSMCISDLKQPLMGLMISYTDAKEVGQIAFIPAQVR
jgi:hypothetical protein